MNGDGRADIIGFGGDVVYVALAKTDNSGTFEVATPASSQFGNAAWGTFDLRPRQVADVDGDNLPEIVGFAENNVRVALPDPNGTFHYNSYGKMAVKLYEAGSLFTGRDLTGQFGEKEYTLEWHDRGHANNVTSHYAMVSGDFNGDGQDDLLRMLGNPAVHLSNGDGTFANNGSILSYDNSDRHHTKAIVGDFNGDGYDDIIRQERGPLANGVNDVQIYFSQGDGTFSSPTDMTHFDGKPHHGNGVNIVVGDFNGDGKDDFIRQEKGDFDNGNNDAIVYYANSNGNGSFYQQNDLTHFIDLDGSNVNMIVGDFNGDGKDDFIRQEKGSWANGQYDNYLYYANPNGDGSFTWQNDITGLNLNGNFTDLFALNFDGDGDDDLIRRDKADWADYNNGGSYVLINNGDGTFTAQNQFLQAQDMKGYHKSTQDDDINPGSAIITGDFNGDGKDGFVIQKLPALIDYHEADLWDSVTGFADSIADAATDIADSVADVAGDLADYAGDAAEAAGQAVQDAVALLGDWWIKYYLEYVPSPYKNSNGDGYTVNMFGGGVAYGDSGNNDMNSWAIAVSLHGEGGDDDINAYGGINIIDGGSGNDDINAVGGANAVITGSGNDDVTVAGLANVIYSEGGYNETMYGAGGGNLFIKTGSGTERMASVGGANFLIKTADGNSEMIAGGAGNIMFKNGSGNDLMVGLGGANLMVKNGSGSSKMFAGGIGNLITSWGDSEDIIGAAAVANAIIAGAEDDIVIAAGKGNIAFGDSLGDAVDLVNFTPAGMALGTIGSLLDKVGLDNLNPMAQVNNALSFLKGSSAGNDTMVVLGKTNLGVGGNGQDIVVSGGANNFVFGDNLLDIADDVSDIVDTELNDILGKLSLDATLPDLSFDFNLSDWTNDFQFSTPDFSGFGLNASAPSIGLSLPSFTLPDLSSYLPNLSGLSLPSGLDSINLPDIDLSSININDLLAVPSFSLPDLSAYGVSDLTSRFSFDFYNNDGDILFAAGKTNVIAGGNGSDISISAGEKNYLMSGDGNDLVLGAGKENKVFGNDGNDLVFTGGNQNIVKGGNDDDTLVTAGQTNTVDGDAGVDILLGIGKTSTLNGGADKDILIGVGIGEDSTLNGDDGDDILLAGGKNNTFNGGAGNDKYILDGLLQQGVTTIDNEGGGNDKVIFAPTVISTSQLDFEQVANSDDLAIDISFGTYTNQAIVKDWFDDATKQIDTFEVNGSDYTLNGSLDLVAVA